MTEQGVARGPAALLRYWPVALVLVVVAAIFAVGALGSDGSEEDAAVDTTAATETSAAGDDAGEDDAAGQDRFTWSDEDPLEAPDCDPETGRIMVPSLYAPNCVPLWPEGADNGGATWRGVTEDEIVVAVYQGRSGQVIEEAAANLGIPTPSEQETIDNRLRVVEAYSALYETYGRSVRVEPLLATGIGSDEAAARADAIRAAEELDAFAVIGGPTGTTAFVEELVAREVLCLCTFNEPIQQYERWAPYVWPQQMASTQGMLHIADYLAMRLAGKPAEFAGDPTMHERERVFGFVWFETAEGTYQQGTDFFLDRLEDMGVEIAIDIPYIMGGGENMQEDSLAIIARLKEAGVTTVVFGGDPVMPIYLTQQATSQEFFPEWAMTGFLYLDVAGYARQYDAQQWPHAFGLSLTLPPVAEDVTQREGNLVSWYLEEELSTYPTLFDLGRFFTGVHLAGPDLTPETFRDGMFSFEPVRGHRTAWAVSYGEGLWPWVDYTAAEDVTEIWWDPEAVDPRVEGEEVRGMYRYTDGARRFLPGELDQIEGELFNPEGTVTIFDERPAEDQIPRYPHRAGRSG